MISKISLVVLCTFVAYARSDKCKGLLSAVSGEEHKVRAADVKRTAPNPQHPTPQYVKECDCLISKNKPYPYGGIGCNDAQWREKLEKEIKLHEGDIRVMYCDALGLVTTGIGVLIQNKNTGAAFSFVYGADHVKLWEKNGKPATRADVEAEFKTLATMCEKRRKFCLKKPKCCKGEQKVNCDHDAGDFKKSFASVRAVDSTLKLSDSSAKTLFRKSMDRMVKGSKEDLKESVNFDELPSPAKAAIVDLRYGMGTVRKTFPEDPGKAWPSLHNALKINDFNEAANQIFTKTGRLWVGCQRWKFMKDAATCQTGGRILEATTTESSVAAETTSVQPFGGVECEGMLTRTDADVMALKVMNAASEDGIEDETVRFVEECKCLASRQMLTSVACDEDEANWQQKAGAVSADCVSGTASDYGSNFANLPPPAKASLVHLRAELGSVPRHEWSGLFAALDSNQFADASTQIFTASAMKQMCQRWKWMNDAATCPTMRFRSESKKRRLGHFRSGPSTQDETRLLSIN